MSVLTERARSGFCLLVLVFGLGSCSGGSSGSSSSGFIDRSGVITGQISGFGSVIVNGVAYDTQSSEFSIDDIAGQESDLSVGQVVTIQGQVTGAGVGRADTVWSDPLLQGPITQLDVPAGVLTVLETQVRITVDTLFGAQIVPADVMSLALGEVLEIYGFQSSTGDVTATLVRRSASQELEIRGRISNLNIGVSEFSLGNLTVEYSAANLVGVSSQLVDGNLVEVEAELFDSTGRLVAQRVELETTADFVAEEEGTEVEIEGFVTRFVNLSDFDVDGVAATTDSGTQYEGGDASTLQLDVRVEIEGIVDANGRVVADKVEFESSSDLELEAPVETVEPTTNTVTLLGIAFQVTHQTQLIDEADSELRNFSLDDVAVNDWLVVKASSDSAVLNLLKRKNPEDKVQLAGQVGTVNPPSLTVLSAEILTDAHTAFELNDVAVDSSVFFAGARPGQQVSAQGQTTMLGLLVADSVEIDD